MKKIAMFIAAAAIAVSASAQKQAITASKAGDNIYVGLKGGVATSLKDKGEVGAFSSFDPSFGIRVGKNFTTVFGLAIDANMYMNAHKNDCDYGLGKTNKNFVKGVDVNLLGTANLMNLFGGYNGEPRTFEIIALGGFGWGHAFRPAITGYATDGNAIVSKVAVDFAINFGGNKQWQAYLEPSLNYVLESFGPKGYDFGGFKYDINRSMFGIQAGVNYKFACSNGKHNFAYEQLRDQAEIDNLNAQINAARSEADKAKADAKGKDAKIAELQKKLNDCLNKPAPVVEKKAAANLQPSVVFGQGKSNVEKSQMPNIQMIANYMKAHPETKVKVSGYASPEGSKEFNQKLSEKRADAVKNVLVKNYKIAADRIETEGLGATDKLFDEVEFNRVALFNDTNK